MKNLISVLFLLFSFNILLADNSKFILTRDTIQVNLEGDLYKLVLLEDKYYCFTEMVTFSALVSKSKMYIFSTDGKIEYSATDYPYEIRRLYSDFYLKDNDLVIKTYYDGNSFIFNKEKLSWEETEPLDDFVYEDENFYVTSLDFGEWGSATWFRDKATGKEFRLAAKTPVINKLNGKYYLTLSDRIIEVSSPYDLHECTPREYYQYTVDNKKFTDELYYMQGAKIIYDLDVGWGDQYSDCPTSIETSFIHSDSLYHILTEGCSTYLVKLEKDSLVKLETLGKDISVFRYNNCYRHPIRKDGSQTLMFCTNDDKLCGLLYVKGNRINLNYIDNEYKKSFEPRGREVVDSIFERRLAMMIKDEERPDIYSVCELENKVNYAVDISPFYSNSDSLRSYMAFRVVEDSTFTHDAIYYYSQKDNLIKYAKFEWRDEVNRIFEVKAENRQFVEKLFKERFIQLSEYITRYLSDNDLLVEQEYTASDDIQWKTTTGYILNLSRSKSGYIRSIDNVELLVRRK